MCVASKSHDTIQKANNKGAARTAQMCRLWDNARIQRGDTWVGIPPMKNKKKNIGFLSNTGPDPLKNHKATKPAITDGLSLALQQNVIFKWCFAGRPMMARL